MVEHSLISEMKSFHFSSFRFSEDKKLYLGLSLNIIENMSIDVYLALQN